VLAACSGDNGTQKNDGDEGEISNLVNEGKKQLQADAAAAVAEENEGAAKLVENEAAAAAQPQEEQLAAAVIGGQAGSHR